VQDFAFNTTRSLKVVRGGAARLADSIAAMTRATPWPSPIPGCAAPACSTRPWRASPGQACVPVFFSDVQPDPPEHVILAAVDAARACEADCIIGFGGGSSMDVAKLASAAGPQR